MKTPQTERYRRIDTRTLEIAVTIDDPKAYTKPWINEPKQYNLEPTWEIGEHYCVIDEETAYGKTIRVPAGQIGEAGDCSDAQAWLAIRLDCGV